jgi:hypothetical protein
MAQPHMHGVKPLGACYAAGCANARDRGLGDLRALSDEHLLEVLGHLPAEGLVRLSAASRALYCFCNHEDLWKAMTLEVCKDSQTAPLPLVLECTLPR